MPLLQLLASPGLRQRTKRPCLKLWRACSPFPRAVTRRLECGKKETATCRCGRCWNEDHSRWAGISLRLLNNAIDPAHRFLRVRHSLSIQSRIVLSVSQTNWPDEEAGHLQ